MIRYPHPALSNLYLLNGYEEIQTSHGPATHYKRLDELERCVRRVLIRKPARLRGWDLRFLRRSLNLSQPDFGTLVDRDAQTVARWEKSTEALPTFVDLTIRTKFVEHFEPDMPVAELASYVDGTAPALPNKILLTLTAEGWQFDLNPAITRARVEALTTFEIGVPRWPKAVYWIKGISGPIAAIATRDYDVYPLKPVSLSIMDPSLDLTWEPYFQRLLTVEQEISDDHSRVTLQ